MKFDGKITPYTRTTSTVIGMNPGLSARAAAHLLGVTPTTLNAWNESCVGPMPDGHGRYEPAAVTAWAAEMTAGS